ncbi:D(5)-like dopamine receptor [Collichthys lucidus]|uniref:D(5)-like dopamine receptor n=1 Tax=Collichthys lucidus TaxID=240159 RepID=A0A4U5VMV7_COLLU|nr:D(5)-like dopamine receptor [Collichthys lucidus]
MERFYNDSQEDQNQDHPTTRTGTRWSQRAADPRAEWRRESARANRLRPVRPDRVHPAREHSGVRRRHQVPPPALQVTNSFVISLAVSDLFVAVLVMPWEAIPEVTGTWLFGRFCEVWIAFDIMCSTASILNLCIISVDRYWAIASPFNSTGTARTRTTPPRTPGRLQREPEPDLRAISSSLISFYIPVVIMVGTTACAKPTAPRVDARRELAEDSFKRETKVLKTLSIIMGVFVFCWLPFFVLNCVVPFCDLDKLGDPPCVSDTTFSIFVWFGWANSSLNPVIYAFNADFRKAFSTILGCHKYCSSSTVEAVDFSNELVSYHHDTTMQKEVCAMPGPGPQRLLPPPHAPHTGGDLEQDFDKVSVISGESRNHNLLLPALLQYECEAEISLDMMPFNSSGPTDSYLIPGQIQDL